MVASVALAADKASSGDGGSASGAPGARAAALACAWRPFAATHRRAWWDCVSLPEDVPRSGEAAFRDALRRLADGSRRRLAAALPAQAAAWPALFHARTFGAVIGMFELNNLDVVVESPVENYFLFIDDLPEPDRAAAIGTTGPLLDALDAAYATPLDGTGLFAVVACANHSCAPAAASRKGEADLDGGAVLVAMRDIAAGEEVTICYIDSDESSVRKRRAALADYGFACACERCAADDARRAAAKAAKAAGGAGGDAGAAPAGARRGKSK